MIRCRRASRGDCARSWVAWPRTLQARLKARSRPGRASQTPITGQNRANGRPTSPSRRVSKRELGMDPRCSWCGERRPRGRRTCGAACEASTRGGTGSVGQSRSRTAATPGVARCGHRTLDDAARVKLAARQRDRRREEHEWNVARPERADADLFRLEVLPMIQELPLRELSRRTRLSVGSCARIRRGQEVPRRRWWTQLVKPDASRPEEAATGNG